MFSILFLFYFIYSFFFQNAKIFLLQSFAQQLGLEFKRPVNLHPSLSQILILFHGTMNSAPE